MALNSSFQQINLRERRLQFIRTHLEAFDVEPIFPIPLFEEAVLEIEGACGIESSCKVEGGRLLAGRFEVCNNQGTTWPQSLTHAFTLLDKIENRLGVSINRESFEQFAAAHIGSRKIINNTIGIHVSSKLEESSVTVYIHIDHHKDPEELARTAIALDGGHYSDELTQVLIRDMLMIGFELFFDGRSHVELLPAAPAQPGALGIRGKYLTPYIHNYCSPKINSIFRQSSVLIPGFSKAYTKPVFWFYFTNIKDISKCFLFNSLGDRIYDFCQSQSCITDTAVVVTESELEKSRLENFCFFYNQRDDCQPNPLP
ncbi:MAG: LynF/TruF/PatF family peptide O-prenyltransferase [Microcoleus sp. PH2017_15_JOR_U_A]|jgi:LynF/TruF/PatF family peptide O-prenyltransferase|uniref:LynF/TruF/PatF family peptide O-prenyltransferase n=1 Tax=unclassified Microcoleus TaxID=2642155 RepID=UPI001D53410B|nr:MULTISPECIES: LynF/TruF/PatF family peptide O-prenyltransferase [unclassified Microcoleus]MCC3474664.1 LynF/TruF/PatF family peptide O-prenyltransferase [Microcoleus sp. PH2017_13_LAR_U_A]MCC3487166.1 LynF/TruF/PatF family peptide O-prenyltransferase [Microcoleus sp. PH2017_14_LAR_D_A]MCC3497123.1 LynF/TruF/PatF family peptide O-prenyltransferase [Microcoleus sp. PH2017_15_JOR_U_A]MCC3599483.1 LynF/TruF/PatF family peptide O-prenyltransferase [Microcoleus sp. PH2017_26_ELK_O_A]MCC3624513.1 